MLRPRPAATLSRVSWSPPAARYAVAAALAIAALSPLPARAADETEDDAFLVPSKGEDVVRLDDGRTIRCRLGPKEGANLRLEFPDGAVVVPAARVAKAFRFKDYDGTPRNDDEKAKLAKGLDRWAGDWLTPTRIAELRAKHLVEEKKALADLRPARDWSARHIVVAGVFKVQSDLPLSRVREYAALLERYMDCLRKEVQVPLPSIAPGSVSVYIHRDRNAFTKHAARDGGAGEHTIGYFQPGSSLKPGHLVLFDMPDDPAETLDTLLHESTHFFLHSVTGNRGSNIRPWIDEGLSEYLGGSTWKYGRFQPGALQEGRLLWFQEMMEREGVVPLARLTELSEATGSKTVSEEDRFGLDHYAEAWCFVHFLFHGRNGYYSGAIRDYLKSGKFTEGTSYLLTRLERKDWSVIEKQFLEYARGLKLTGGRAYGKRALIRISENEIEGAKTDLDAAERLAGKDLPSLVLAARAAVGLGQKDRAAELLRRALELDPLDARLRLERAWCLAGDDGAKEARLAAALAPQDALIVARAGRRERSRPRPEGGDDGDDDPTGGMFFPGSYADQESATEIAVAIKEGRIEEARKLVGTIKDRETPLAVGLVAVLDGVEKGAEAFAATLGALRKFGTPAEDLADAVGWATGVAFHARKAALLAPGLDALYASRPPGTEPEWACWAMSHLISSNPARALELIDRGIAAHPDSEQLKGLRDAFNERE